MSSSPVVSPIDSTKSVSPSVSHSVSPSVYPSVSPVAVSTSLKPRIVDTEIMPLRIIIGAIWFWSITFGLSFSTVMHGFETFMLSAITCVGILGILAIIVIPFVYSIRPEVVVQFKFGSLAPILTATLAAGLFRLDHIVNQIVVRYTTTKRMH